MLRNLTLRQSVAVGKGQHVALALGQRLERQAQAEGLVGRHGELLGRATVVDGVDLGRRHAQRAPAVGVERGVARDAADPGAGRSAGRVEGVGVPPDGRERVLRGVLGRVRLAQDAQAGAVDGARVAVVQLGERDAIAARDAREQSFGGRGRHDHGGRTLPILTRLRQGLGPRWRRTRT